MIKKLLNKLNFYSRFQIKFFNYYINRIKEVNHKKIKFSIFIPNKLCEYRVETFSTKEPETLEWIDSMKPNSILFDVGANIGLYSIYAAKKNIKVIAFEPSVFNLEFLTKNIYHNNLKDIIDIFPLPLSNFTNKNSMKYSSAVWGGALSTFGENKNWNGEKMVSEFEHSTFSITLDKFIDIYNLQYPDYIKIDVDGIEHLIISAGQQTLRNCKSILIEINDNYIEQKNNSEKILKSLGFELFQKRNSDIVRGYKGFDSTFNQIWINKNL